MGLVFKVWDPSLGRYLAVKVAHQKLADPASIARFANEVRVTAKLHHPGIVAVVSMGQDDEGRTFFAMPLVEGRTLRKVLLDRNDGEWTQTRLIDVLLRVCETVAYSHGQGVVHRDLKPDNIMLGRFGEVYVLDWGLALEIDREPASDLTQIGGTAPYMSPEHVEGDVRQIDARSDVYSLGAVLYEILTGWKPFTGPAAPAIDSRTILARIREGPPAPVQELRRKVPSELVAICEKAMARRKDDRYSTMRALAEDLRAYLERRVVKAYRVGALAELRKWVSRNRATAGSLAAGLILSLAGLGAYVQVKREALAEAIRNADSQLLPNLRREAEEDLWPVRPERVPAMEGWLARAAPVAGRIPGHQKELERLRLRALPYTPEDRQKDRASDPDLEPKLAFAKQFLEKKNLAPEERAKAEKEAALLEERISRRRTWRFERREDRVEHEALSRLVGGLEELAGEKPTSNNIRGIERRLQEARSLKERTVSVFRAKWEGAIRSIANEEECPRYNGLKIEPQVGLVPMGRNPQSGLWEFGHPQTGEVPALREDGSLELTQGSSLVFVLLPGGTFLMGCWGSPRPGGKMPNLDADCSPKEEPPHAVELSPFFISKYEMTQGNWLRVMGENPSFFSPGRLAGGQQHTLRNPVEHVSWLDCKRALFRLGLELPTEAQWEYAARGGTSTVYWTGDDPRTLEDAANLLDSSAAPSIPKGLPMEDWDDRYTAHSPVGTFRANGFGLYDVCGNLWEWCADQFDAYGKSRVRAGDGLHVLNNPYVRERVFRGGSFETPAYNARSAHRYGELVNFVSSSHGVRPARALDLERP